MSRAVRSRYELERAARQAVFLTRVKGKTQEFYEKFASQYAGMLADGLQNYVPDEMSRLGRDLEEIRRLLATDPVRARELSRNVGNYIWRVGRLGRAALRQFNHHAGSGSKYQAGPQQPAPMSESNNSELMSVWYKQVGKITPIQAHFAHDELQKIRQQIETGKIGSKGEVEAGLARIFENAQVKTENWKQETQAACAREAMEDRLANLEADMGREKIEDKTRNDELTEKIRNLRNSLQQGNTPTADFEEKINEVEKDIEDTVIDEETRRQAVIAFVKILREQEFNVDKPVLIRQGDENYVKLVARRHSGKQVECHFDLHGKLQYKFDHYEGMTCLKDIEKVKIDLDRIYSIKLSDERVVWENPDRLSTNAFSTPSSHERGGKA